MLNLPHWGGLFVNGSQWAVVATKSRDLFRGNDGRCGRAVGAYGRPIAPLDCRMRGEGPCTSVASKLRTFSSGHQRSRTMRWVQSLVVFSALGRVAVSTESQWIVIGTNGRIVDVDPTPYMPENRRRRALDPVLPPVVADRVNERDGTSMETSDLIHSEVKGDVESVLVPSEDLSIFDDEDGEDDVHESRLLHNVFIPDVETLAKELKEQQKLQEWEDEEMEMELEATDIISPSVSLTAPPSQLLSSTYESKLSPLFDAITLLREEDIQGSVLFAELSCLFVVFIGYLVHTIPLWMTFSRGQKGCLYMAYSVAAMYQFVALAWYMNFVSVSVMLGLSSLITRLISLGMVPITTSSFMSHAHVTNDAAVHPESSQITSVSPTPSGNSSRHRHAKNRS